MVMEKNTSVFEVNRARASFENGKMHKSYTYIAETNNMDMIRSKNPILYVTLLMLIELLWM